MPEARGKDGQNIQEKKNADRQIKTQISVEFFI